MPNDEKLQRIVENVAVSGYGLEQWRFAPEQRGHKRCIQKERKQDLLLRIVKRYWLHFK